MAEEKKKSKKTAVKTTVKETAVVEDTVVEEIVAPEPVVEDTVFGSNLEERAKAQVTAEVGNNACPYCGCVDTLTPAGIVQSEELKEYRCSMCGKIHGYNLVEKAVAWTV